MSKIFEAASKDGLLDSQEIPSVIAEVRHAPDGAGDASRTSVNAGETELRAAESSDAVKHVVSLRVSALTPVFPFFEESQSAAAEQYRIIRTKILHSPKRPRFVVVSSPSSGDGKTITSINIAASLSLKENTSVLLVDADLRRPMVAELLGIPNAPGIADVLAGQATLDSAMVHVHEFPNLSILPAGDAHQRATELLHSQRWPGIIEQFRTKFDVVIMDATPVAVVADYELLQHVAEGVIIVVRPDHSDRKACFTALQSVPKEKFIGIVLNCVENWLLSKSYDYGYYGKKYKPAGRGPASPLSSAPAGAVNQDVSAG